MFNLFEKLLEDGVAEVRDAMVRSLAKLELIFGEDFFNPIKGKVNKKIQSKLEKQETHDRSVKKKK